MREQTHPIRLRSYRTFNGPLANGHMSLNGCVASGPSLACLTQKYANHPIAA